MSVDTSRSSTAAPSTPSSGTFAALALPNYRVFTVGALVSNVGTWMQRVAQDWLVLDLSGGSGVAVGIPTALQFVGMLVLSTYAGVMADRFDRRRILLVTQTWLALCAAALGVLAITGVAQTWHVYLIAFLFGLGTAFDNPARQAFVYELVGPERLPNAIGLNSASFHAARIVGPAVAGFVIAGFGTGWAILSNAVTYLAFILALRLLNPWRLQVEPRTERSPGQIREGIAYVRRHRQILLALGVALFVGTFGMNFQLTSALMAQQEFGLGAQQYGLLGTFVAVGSLTGALLAARRTRAPSGRFVVGSALAFGAIEAVAGIMPTYATFAAVLPVMGLACLLTLTAANAAVQLRVDPALRGRVMALYATVLLGGTPIGAPIIGWVGEVFGPRWTLIGGGGLTMLGVALTALLLGRAAERRTL